MCRIITVDLDGTLLSSKNKITEYTKKIINLLTKKNFFIIASGRHYLDVIKIRDILNIQSFMITSNGARIYDLDNKLIFSDDLDKDIALKLCKIVYEDKDIITQIYRNNKWYINNNKIDNNFCPSLTSLEYKNFNLENFRFNKINKIFFTSKNFHKLYNLEKKIIQSWNNKVNISFSVPGCLEVVSGKSSKGYGLKLISRLLNIPLKNCFSFGDGMNDHDMLVVSGKSYIMKNADLRLKNALPNVKIIESNDNDGVAKCLYEIFIKNKKNIL
ncbi:MAG: Cof-type HAD-IIB family hydrolase [Buchnera aphidicola (Brevicoryne brassicae)]|uniref:Cof-type HAD-IIB family hydrolase n=1 Tax=Buchnera aphidicola (Brevicoryne brassicae) TaxID=911343 RepID=A0AAJ5PVM9_9GAMM|nr:Cof-type HAD-IIB family hydrolase [Buchnera aphidicola]QCI19617.1 Cof-type HAD-IIB family hydrolase [Buchnera aphidicola (Brevicoryne brassicae)]WAI18988.1 MAG: Cof-type HAD-IIB family hydrolase [Buchnera aphidicola (Brevicoryne brassicae)]